MPRREPQVTHEQIGGQTVCRVELTKGKTALIDPADWQRIAAQYGTRWAAVSNGRLNWSARKGHTREDGRIVMQSLTRAVMNAKDGERVETKNGNALDVRRCNLTLERNGTETRQAKANRRHRQRQANAEAQQVAS